MIRAKVNASSSRGKTGKVAQKMVEEILLALNERRGEDFQYRMGFVDDGEEGCIYAELRGNGGFCADDLRDIMGICERHGFTLDYFDVDLDEEKGELVLSLSLRALS
jgi:hypothetical protein